MCPLKKIAVEVPLLFEARASSFADFFDTSLCIWAKPDTMVDRLVKNRRMAVNDAVSRIEMQMKPEEKVSLCDYAVENSKDLSIEDFKQKISKVIDEIEQA